MDLGGKAEIAKAIRFAGEGRGYAHASRWHRGKENEERKIGYARWVRLVGGTVDGVVVGG